MSSVLAKAPLVGFQFLDSDPARQLVRDWIIRSSVLISLRAWLVCSRLIAATSLCPWAFTAEIATMSVYNPS